MPNIIKVRKANTSKKPGHLIKLKEGDDSWGFRTLTSAQVARLLTRFKKKGKVT